MYKAFLIAALVAVPAIAAAQSNQPGAAGGTFGRPTAGSCGVTRMDVFDRFVATKPTPNAFQAAYSCIALIMPGDITTLEFRTDNSRYYAELDTHGRIVGGRFR